MTIIINNCYILSTGLATEGMVVEQCVHISRHCETTCINNGTTINTVRHTLDSPVESREARLLRHRKVAKKTSVHHVPLNDQRKSTVRVAVAYTYALQDKLKYFYMQLLILKF